MRDPGSILITGASSGIGEALARAYAAPGVHLALAGRNEERLEGVAEACRAAGAEVAAQVLEVADAAATAAWVEASDDRRPLELVIANAGVGAGVGRGGEPPAQVRQVLAVNVDGVMNTVLPAVERMRARPPASSARRGQIAIMSSLAGFRGFSGAPAYCASKAAVRVYGEALRGTLRAEGIAVSVICPGFVKSRMTARNKFPMPFLMDSDRAAAIIKRGLARDRGRIAFPWPMYATVWLIASLPPRLTDAFVRRLPDKE